MKTKNDRIFKHKVASEICNKKGAWNKTAMAFSNDFDKALRQLTDKYEGKLSVDAMQMIISNCTNLEVCYLKALSA